MQAGRRQMIVVGAAIAWCGALGAASVAGQSAPAQAPMAETVFKNVQVLRGIPVDEFMDTMGMFASSLGYDCASCHAAGISTNRDLFAESTPSIQKARQMVLMVNAINRANFGGEPRVSCYTCHRTHYRPEVVPSLDAQYADLIEDPSSVNIVPDRGVSADPIFAKYLDALGGAARVGALTSVVARGSYAGFNTGGGTVPVEIYTKAPNQRAVIIKMPQGDASEIFDGTNAWVAAPWKPMPLMTLTADNVAGARLDALLMFPATLQKAFSQWQVTTVTLEDDRTVRLAQGRDAAQRLVNFYFDEAGLLVRLIRWNKTTVGTIPVQIDYASYRDVGGVKFPFQIRVRWTNGQDTIAFTDVQTNVAIAANRFAQPAPYTAQ
ncbi:MAG: photosynthetic reaction center cytochrome c subunit family protein [Vicinamibacterales bacterium]